MTRTSATDPIRVDWLPLNACGRLGMTFAPGKRCTSVHAPTRWRRSLAVDLRALRAQGVTHLVCLLEPHELQSLRIERLVARAAKVGIHVTQFPVRDLDTPHDTVALRRLLRRIGVSLGRGASIVIHCAGGLGRTGVVAGCALVELAGMSGEAALHALSRARGPRCPETGNQRIFVDTWGNSV